MSLLETINELGTDKTKLLHFEEVNGEPLTVRQYQNYRWLSVGGEMIQSLIDLEQPARLLLPNLVAMLAVLEFVDNPASLLNLGAGGGAMERHFRQALPDLSITSIESNERIIRLAERFFDMSPEGVILDSAEHFLSVNEQSYDIILIDIYSGERQAACFYESDFHKSLAAALTSGGAIAMNLLPHSEEELLRILRPLIDYVSCVLLYMVPNHDNVIVYAIKQDSIDQEVFGRRLKKVSEQGLELQVIAQAHQSG